MQTPFSKPGRFWRGNCTTLLFTHDQSEALTAADNLFLMNDGDIIQQGHPLEVYRQPRTLFSANFIGTNNLLPCTITAIEADCIVLQLDDAAQTFLLPTQSEEYQVGPPVWVCIRAEDVDVSAPEQSAVVNPVTIQVRQLTLTGGFVRVDGYIEKYPLQIHVAGGARFGLLESRPSQLLCSLGHLTLVPRHD